MTQHSTASNADKFINVANGIVNYANSDNATVNLEAYIHSTISVMCIGIVYVNFDTAKWRSLL